MTAAAATVEESFARRLALFSAGSFALALLALVVTCQLGELRLVPVVAVAVSVVLAASAAASVVGGGLASLAAAVAAFSGVGLIEFVVFVLVGSLFCHSVLS